MGILPIPRTLSIAFKCKKTKAAAGNVLFPAAAFSYAFADNLHLKTPTLQPTVAHSSANPAHDSRT